MVEVVDAASLRPLQLRSCRVMARVKGLAAEAIVNLDYSNEAERSAEVLLLLLPTSPCDGDAWSVVGLQAVSGGRAGQLAAPRHRGARRRDGTNLSISGLQAPRGAKGSVSAADYDFSFVMEARGHCLLAGVDSVSGHPVRVDAAPCAPTARSVFVTLLDRSPEEIPIRIRLHPSESNAPYVLTERGEMSAWEYAQHLDSRKISRYVNCPDKLHNMLRRRMYRDVMLLPAVMLAFSPALLEPWDQPTSATTTSLPRVPCGVAAMARGPCTELIFVVDRALANSGGAAARNVKEAMIVLLKSLPMRCYFNVVSYSSTFQLLFARSRPYSNETLQKACAFVRRLRGETPSQSDPVGPLAWALGVGTKWGGAAAPAGAARPRRPLGGTAPGSRGAPGGASVSSLGAPDGDTQGGESSDEPLDELFLLSGPGGGADAGQVLSMARVYGRGTRCFTFAAACGASPPRFLSALAALSRGHAEVIQPGERFQPKPALAAVSVEWRLPPGLLALPAAPAPSSLLPGDSLTACAFLSGARHGLHVVRSRSEKEPAAPGIKLGQASLHSRIQRGKRCQDGRTEGSEARGERGGSQRGSRGTLFPDNVGGASPGRAERAASPDIVRSQRLHAGRPPPASRSLPSSSPATRRSRSASGVTQRSGSLTFLATWPEQERSTAPGAPEKKHAGSPLGEPKRRGAKQQQQQRCGLDRQTSATDHRDPRDAKPGTDHRPRNDADPRPHGPPPTERSPRRREPGFAGSPEEPDPDSGLAVIRAVFDGRPVEWRARFDVRALMEEGSPAGAVDADAESGGQIHLVAARALARELERKAEREACDSARSRRWLALAVRASRASGVPCRHARLASVDAGSGAPLSFPAHVRAATESHHDDAVQQPVFPSAPSQSSLDGLLASRLARRCSQALQKASCPSLWKGPGKAPAPRAEDDLGTPAYAALLDLQEAEGSFSLSPEFAEATGVGLEQLARSSPFASLRQIARHPSLSHPNPSVPELSGFKPASEPAGARHRQLMEQVASAFSRAASDAKESRGSASPTDADAAASSVGDPRGPGPRRPRHRGQRERAAPAGPKAAVEASREAEARVAEGAAVGTAGSSGDETSASEAGGASSGRRVGGADRGVSWEARGSAGGEDRGEAFGDVDRFAGDDDDDGEYDGGNIFADDDDDDNYDDDDDNYDDDGNDDDGNYDNYDDANDDGNYDDSDADDDKKGTAASPWPCGEGGVAGGVAGDGDDAGRAWATAVALAWLEGHCAGHLHEWELAAGKAQRWLEERRGGGDGLLLALRHWDRKLDFTLLCYNQGSS
ncbi:von Willebrand factor A domain-containing protein 5B1-like [Lethenteron reissneri]|uniref:von Willebrand factor A domain-containing protein 5B1-like n=1 Tax=Lethenteron reissneri TaxID=7753 RepID=UPI002AB7DCC0|nr:von Willebrand factor A domain-containing protein 5B1-like [Lethenteron reissneri]